MENKEGRFYKAYMKMKRKICGVLAAVILVSAPMACYQEAEAAALVGVLGGLGLVEILETLVFSAGLTALGYTSIKNLTSSQKDELTQALEANSTVSSALEDAEDWAEENEFTVIDGGLSHSSNGFNFNGNDDGTLDVTLTAGLISEAVKSVKSWAESDANVLESTAEIDEDSFYLSVEEYVLPGGSYDSLSAIDDLSYYGAYNDLLSAGLSEDSAVILYNGSSSAVYAYEIPAESYLAVVYPKSSDMGVPYILSYDDVMGYESRVSNYGWSSAYSWIAENFDPAPRYVISSTGGVTVESEYSTTSVVRTLCPTYSYSRFFYSFGYSDFYDNGFCFFDYFKSGSTIDIYKYVLSYSDVSQAIIFNTDTAPSYEDGWTYTISEDAVSTITASEDLTELIAYINSLSEYLSELGETSTENQEVIIEQNESILDALNGSYSYTKNIAGNVASILTAMGNIYTAITGIGTYVKALPASISEAFSGYYTALPASIADAISETFPALSLTLSDAIAETYPALVSAMADSLADVIPGADVLADALVGAIPAIDLDDITDAVIALPGVITDAIGDIAITVPEIVIPEIAIPEITVTVPEIAVPDVAVTLDPSFDITVENDFAGVEGYIYSAVLAVLTAVFVPDTDLTLERVGTIQSYFGFVDDIKGIAADFQTSVFGITPSPYLNIPIGSPTSDYNYGLGSYITIDISWYADYKEYGDKLILALVWALFLWKLFVLLPGIINGTSGFFSDKPESHGLDLTVSGGIDNLPLLEDKHR